MSSRSVVLVSGSFFPREGGSEKQWRFIMSAMAEKGYAPVVYTQRPPRTSRSEIVDGITVRRVGFAWMYSVPLVGKLYFLLVSLVSLVIARPLTLCSSMLGSSTVAVSAAARILGRKHVVRLTGGGGSLYRSEPLHRASRLLDRNWCRLLSNSRTTVVAPASHLISDFWEAFPNHRCRALVISNAVQRPMVSLSRQRSEMVAWYARRGSQSAQADFVQVASSLPDVSFFTFGEKRGISLPNVRECGWLSRPETLLRRCKVILNTSPTEGMPNATLLGLACGCAAIGADNFAFRELAAQYPDSVATYSKDDQQSLANVLQEELDAYSGVAPLNLPFVDELDEPWMNLLFE